MERQKPLLSIGIIFRNDVRSLERCLMALQPLRNAVPCELVMADTGSEDGSREIAQRYADVVFDFPWINDFSAARNAVMDRCSGRWFFTVDSDEYLDANISELVHFLKTCDETFCVATVIQRNYDTAEMNSIHVDFGAVRLMRMSTGLRYQNRIHEYWDFKQFGKNAGLPRTILHHDGYAGLGRGEQMDKLKRNLRLLKEELERDPKNLRILLQYIESDRLEPDFLEHLRYALAQVKEKRPDWESFGPPILRYAVQAAQEKRLPELAEWLAWAEEWFPDSFFTRLDVEYIAFADSWDRKDYIDCVHRGERYLKAMADYREAQRRSVVQMFSSILMADFYWVQGIKMPLAYAYLEIGQAGRALSLLNGLDHRRLDSGQIEKLVWTLRQIHMQSWTDTESTIMTLWECVSTTAFSSQQTGSFYQAASEAFQFKEREKEAELDSFCRYSYTLFLPLRELCELGRGAAILEAKDALAAEQLLIKVEDWPLLPLEALTAAFEHGAAFPTDENPLILEEMDLLALRLAQDQDRILKLAQQAVERGWNNPQTLAWSRGLVLAAVEKFDWKDEQAGMALCRQFAAVEGDFLSTYYSADTLQEKNLPLLPHIHRFGWYCVRAFEALDSGNMVEYVRLLRLGLELSKGMKPMVEFLTKNTPELQRQAPSAEMLALAEQIKTVLSRLPPNDPAVVALKASEAYQKAAYLIERTDALEQRTLLQ